MLILPKNYYSALTPSEQIFTQVNTSLNVRTSNYLIGNELNTYNLDDITQDSPFD